MADDRRRREPTRIASKTVGYTGDLGDVLQKLAAAGGGRRPVGIRRTRSNNPAKVGVNTGLRVTRPREAVPGENPRLPNVPALPQTGQLSLFEQVQDEQLALFDENLNPIPAEAEGQRDRSQVLSPPNTINPGRPRALEARYDPDRKLLTVRFRNGGTYAYYGVPSTTWRALKRNKSFGKTMDRLVLNQYPYQRVSY